MNIKPAATGAGRFLVRNHKCSQPYGSSCAPGDIWQCDDCGQFWRWSKFWYAWRRISKRRAEREVGG